MFSNVLEIGLEMSCVTELDFLFRVVLRKRSLNVFHWLNWIKDNFLLGLMWIIYRKSAGAR